MLPARFAEYEILSVLGEGGMGKVYLAQDTRLPRRVALKTLLSESLQDPGAAQRFQQEAWAASSLNHPNILTIYEVGRQEGRFFIACELIEGETLRHKLTRSLDVAEVVDFAMQAAAGLHAAHSAGIIHRDIKPENLMIRHDGLLKIVDFGLARIAKRPAAIASLVVPGTREDTQPGLVLGTTKYMSPEQARGLPVDPRTDIFSLGAVIYEMLSAKAPFEGETDSDRIAAILLKEPVPLQQVATSAPVELIRVVERAMAKNAESRYGDAAELLADLQTVRHNLALKATLANRRRGPAKWPRRIAISVAALCCLFGAVLFIWHSRSAFVPGPKHPLALAILPFHNLRQDTDNDFLGFSLADAIASKFGYVSSVAVRPSSAVEKYRNQTVDPRTVGTELNASDLLTGNYIRDGDRLRINVQLIDVRENKIVWQDTIDTPYEDLFRVQDRVAQEIIQQLSIHLTPAEADSVGFDTPIGREAYEDYLRGVDLYAMNDFSGAIRKLEQSAALYPNYALTWAHLGQAYTTNASLEFGGRQQYMKAQQAYQRALSLDPALIEARVYMANLLTDTGRVEESVPLLRSALTRNPNNADAHWELGYAYRFAGMLPESLKECLLARQIDPQVKLYSSAINTYLYLGEYNQFLQSLPERRTVYLLFYRGLGEYYRRQYQLALSYFDETFDLNPSLFQAELGRAFASAIRNQDAEGTKILLQTNSRISERGVADPEGLYKLAQAFAAVGDTAAGMQTLKQAVSGGFFCYPYFQRDPLLTSLRSDPEFSTVMAAARQRYEHFRKTFFAAAK